MLVGTASVGRDHPAGPDHPVDPDHRAGPERPETELEGRRAAQGDPGELFIVDRLEVGMTRDDGEIVSLNHLDANGPAYPFSLAEKLKRITEPHPWYTPDGAASSPWGRAVVPMEMISVLAHKSGARWPVRSPALGLFLDLEIRLHAGPVFVGEDYAIKREIVGLSQSRRTESYWTRTTLSAVGSGEPVATVLLHSGLSRSPTPATPRTVWPDTGCGPRAEQAAEKLWGLSGVGCP